MQNEQETLDRELRTAETTLKESLEEACSSNPARADTGELIRIEEVLAIATDAAKKAISIRRKRKLGGPRSADRAERSENADAAAQGAQRTFTDEGGVTWTAWAVHPSDRSAKPRLRGTFQQGWLAFESVTGKRRLSPIPDGWQTADEAHLRTMLSHAEAAPRRSDERLSPES